MDTGKTVRVICGNTELTCWIAGYDYRDVGAGIEWNLVSACSKHAEYSANASRKSVRDVYWTLCDNAELMQEIKSAADGDTLYISYVPMDAGK